MSPLHGYDYYVLALHRHATCAIYYAPLVLKDYVISVLRSLFSEEIFNQLR